MNIDALLALTVSAIKSAAPQALFSGQLIKQSRVFNPSTNVNELTDTVITNAEIIFESLTTSEVSGSTIKSTDVKMHIIANSIKAIDYYDQIRVNDVDYRIVTKLDTVIGSEAALFTIVASVG